MIRLLRAYSGYVLGLTLFAAAVAFAVPRDLRIGFALAGFALWFINGAVQLEQVRTALTLSDGRQSPDLPAREGWLQAHGRLVRRLCLLAGAVGAGYLWAVLFGDGIRGLKSSSQLDAGASFPDANVALMAAGGLCFTSAMLASMTIITPPSSPRAALYWIAGTVLLGAALFAASRLLM